MIEMTTTQREGMTKFHKRAEAAYRAAGDNKNAEAARLRAESLMPQEALVNVEAFRGLTHERNVLRKGLEKIELKAKYATRGHDQDCPCATCETLRDVKKIIAESEE